MIPLLIVGCALAGCETGDQSKKGDETEKTSREEKKMEIPRELEIQGHRGARGLKPENTLPAFETALDLQVDTLELDLHLSKDGKLVVWHDPFVRASKCEVPEDAGDLPEPAAEGETPPAAMVRNLTAAQLAKYRCASNPDAERFSEQNAEPTTIAGAEFGIVTLAGLFDFVENYAGSDEKSEAQRANARRVEFNIETKRHPENPAYIGDGFDGRQAGEFEKKLVELIRRRDLVERVTVQSFDHRSLWAVHAMAPELRLAALESERKEPLSELAKRGAAIWSPNAELVDETSLKEASAAGLRVIPWTVNDIDEMRRLIRVGVDGLITDRPDLVR